MLRVRATALGAGANRQANTMDVYGVLCILPQRYCDRKIAPVFSGNLPISTVVLYNDFVGTTDPYRQIWSVYRFDKVDNCVDFVKVFCFAHA